MTANAGAAGFVQVLLAKAAVPAWWVRVFYYLGAAGIGLGVLIQAVGAISLMSARYGSTGAGFGWLLGAVIGGVLGLMALRIMTDLILAVFQMRDSLKNLENHQGTTTSRAAGTTTIGTGG